MSVKLTRSEFVAGASVFASIGILRFPAAAAEFTLKYANDNPVTHPMGQAALAWADRVKHESSGQVEIQVFPASQLGSDPEMLAQLRIGGIQFLQLSGSVLSTLVPVAAIDDIGFAFPNYNVVWQAMDGELGGYIRGEVEKTGLHVFDKIFDNGFREITTSTRPITKPSDLKGMKLRVPPSKLSVAIFQAFGASPTAISVAEVYSALQTKVVDGQENSLVVIGANKFDEVQKYCALTNHVWSGQWLLANGPAWQKLPNKLQDIVARNYDLAARQERSDFKRLNDSLQPKFASAGMTFTKPDVEGFRAVLRQGGFYTQWRDAFGVPAWNKLEKYTGKLA
jgi:tripartite ATP-independent transporter DctP family solute receptor